MTWQSGQCIARTLNKKKLSKKAQYLILDSKLFWNENLAGRFLNANCVFYACKLIIKKKRYARSMV